MNIREKITIQTSVNMKRRANVLMISEPKPAIAVTVCMVNNASLSQADKKQPLMTF